jgi:hypothetical protein
LRTSLALPIRLTRGVFALLIAAAVVNPVVRAQVVLAPPPTVGSANPVSAEPLVTRPATMPCIVPLFTNVEFDNFSEQPYSYTPPASCPGPWAKVVFTADLTVTAGTQFDRSAQVYLNNVTIYRGTTAEPEGSFSPSWHVERDVTDLSATFYTAANGFANIGNLVNATDNGLIYANAELEFYPVSAAYPAPVVADQVIPIFQSDPSNYYLPSAPLTESITLPMNTQALYLDVTAQTDEFWWLSTPNAQVAALLGDGPVTAFREIDVSIDGTPAGIAPNHPYLFTGGIDPNLWIPITGAQTLNLKPYRINLTPFAGMLDDGNMHAFVLNDVNTQNSVSGGSLVNGNLLVFLDHGSTTVTGALTSNTLTVAPDTTVTSSVNLDDSFNGSGNVTETLDRSFAISGYVNTSQGKITTTVNETENWSNTQNGLSSDTDTVVADLLSSTVDAITTTTTPSATSTREEFTSNPLSASISLNVNPDTMVEAETTTIELGDLYKTLGPGTFTAQSQEDVLSTDTQNFTANGSFTGNSGMASTGTYIYTDSKGNNYSSTLTAANNVLSAATSEASSTGVTVVLTASTTAATQGASVTLSAVVMPKNSMAMPTGDVTFYLNGTAGPVPLGTVQLMGTTASFSVSSLPVGADSITAVYSGDTNFLEQNGLTAVTVNVTALTPTFALGAMTPTALTLTEGQTGVLTLPITANASFSGMVTFACTGAPAETSCTFSPSTVTLTPGQTASVSILVATTAPNNTSEAANRFPGMTALGGVSVAGLCLLLLPKRRSRGWKSMALVVLLGFGLAATTALTGCGGGDKYSGSPAGAPTFTVTATSGSTMQTATFVVTINK